ncbi:MAG TPA: VCBS repeat-containing protein [Gemmataceae bacterium]|nr:VCBS repeat-containing protein [Gemmataceae bacterium]
MKSLLAFLACTLLLFTTSMPSATSATTTAIPKFRMQEIATDLKVGYAVILVDIDGDGKKDIVVVDTTRVVWYQNPTWKMRTIIQGQTAPDNVCIDAYDIDGDGKIDLALGAGWKPANTKTGGTLQWLKRGKTLDEPWTLYPIDSEPTVHRIRFVDLDGSGKAALVLAPLQGRNTTQAKNWLDGNPVRLIAFHIPKDPTRDKWKAEVLDQNLHVLHNICPIPATGRKGMDLLCASYEGLTLLQRGEAGKWTGTRLNDGNQANPKSNRGSSEVKMGQLKNGKKVIATIEPWHGNQVVVYTEPAKAGDQWVRHVLDEKLKWGHAVSFADLSGSGGDDLVIGVRDDLSNKAGERRGVRIYTPDDESGAKWTRHDLDPGGVAVEDLAVADLNGDGRPDIVAVGRQTGNVRIYWNEK